MSSFLGNCLLFIYFFSSVFLAFPSYPHEKNKNCDKNNMVMRMCVCALVMCSAMTSFLMEGTLINIQPSAQHIKGRGKIHDTGCNCSLHCGAVHHTRYTQRPL